MKTVVIYDPADVLLYRVCAGPVWIKNFLRVATTIDNLKKSGADITRFNLAHQAAGLFG